MKGFIYKITNTKTSDLYIGSTIQHPKNRFKAHRSNANLGKPGTLYEAIRKIGVEYFSIEVVEECEIEELDRKEKEYYQKLAPSLNMIAPRIKDREEMKSEEFINYFIDLIQHNFMLDRLEKQLIKDFMIIVRHRIMAQHLSTDL